MLQLQHSKAFIGGVLIVVVIGDGYSNSARLRCALHLSYRWISWGRRDALAQVPRTSLLYIRHIVEPEAFSIFQLEDDARTDVAPPRSQALQLPCLNRN